jgi:SAM-dependent methyltransferase
MYASGAESVCCTDRFPLEKTSVKSTRVYSAILEMLGAEDRERARNAFTIPGRPESGFNHRFIEYSVTRDGLTRKTNIYDLILSRAVLEHVEHVELTIADMADALKKDGVAVHKVDLKSHGLDRGQPLDFLTWSPAVYRLMHSHKGFPNRWRVNKYREIVAGSGLDLIKLTPTEVLDTGLVDSIRPSLAGIFRNVSREDLGWLGFWMVLRRK